MLFLPTLEFLDNAPIGRSPCYHHHRDAALTDAYSPIQETYHKNQPEHPRRDIIRYWSTAAQVVPDRGAYCGNAVHTRA